MPASIDATVGGANANSYVTLAAATSYFAEQAASSSWDGATQDQQIRALITATRRIDEEILCGVRATATQALQWPRYGVRNPDASAAYGGMVDGTTIPARVQRATMKLAYAILAGTYTGAETGLDAFASAKVGQIEVTMRPATVNADVLPDTVRREMGSFILASDGSVRLVKG